MNKCYSNYKINKGEMTYKLHYKLCKKGIESFQK